jgi:hypothetical protein
MLERRKARAVPRAIASLRSAPASGSRGTKSGDSDCCSSTDSESAYRGDADDRYGRPAVVTDDDVHASAIADGSEREPVATRHARTSSGVGVSEVGHETLAGNAKGVANWSSLHRLRRPHWLPGCRVERSSFRWQRSLAETRLRQARLSTTFRSPSPRSSVGLGNSRGSASR